MAATTRWARKRPKIDHRRLVAHLEAPAPDADLDAAAPRLEPDRLGVDALDLDRSFEHQLRGLWFGGRSRSECGPRRRLGLVADDREARPVGLLARALGRWRAVLTAGLFQRELEQPRPGVLLEEKSRQRDRVVAPAQALLAVGLRVCSSVAVGLEDLATEGVRRPLLGCRQVDPAATLLLDPLELDLHHASLLIPGIGPAATPTAPAPPRPTSRRPASARWPARPSCRSTRARRGHRALLPRAGRRSASRRGSSVAARTRPPRRPLRRGRVRFRPLAARPGSAFPGLHKRRAMRATARCPGARRLPAAGR